MDFDEIKKILNEKFIDMFPMGATTEERNLNKFFDQQTSEFIEIICEALKLYDSMKEDK